MIRARYPSALNSQGQNVDHAPKTERRHGLVVTATCTVLAINDCTYRDRHLAAVK